MLFEINGILNVAWNISGFLKAHKQIYPQRNCCELKWILKINEYSFSSPSLSLAQSTSDCCHFQHFAKGDDTQWPNPHLTNTFAYVSLHTKTNFLDTHKRKSTD